MLKWDTRLLMLLEISAFRKTKCSMFRFFSKFRRNSFCTTILTGQQHRKINFCAIKLYFKNFGSRLSCENFSFFLKWRITTSLVPDNRARIKYSSWKEFFAKIKIWFWHDLFHIYWMYSIKRGLNFAKIRNSEYSAFCRALPDKYKTNLHRMLNQVQNYK